MEEIKPGLFHWTATHPDIGLDVSAYWLRDEAVLLNPLAVPADLPGGPARQVVLTNGLHQRDARSYGLPVLVPEPGLGRFDDPSWVLPYGDGDELPGGLLARQIGGLSADEFALLVPSHSAVAIADGVIRMGAPELAFVPDFLMDDPEADKAALKAGFAQMLDDWQFDTLLLAHGDPVVGDGRERLAALIQA